jgi:16S rRNA (guanine(527)-N(7))-methyltransferase RsmG
MTEVTAQIENFRNALETNAGRYSVALAEVELRRLCDYYGLLLAWNPRLHLVARCSPQEFATRHVLESLLLLPHLSRDAHIADVGSGAGLPIIPSLIARSDLHARLIEAATKKAVFLREVLREIQTGERAGVTAERFENLPTPKVDYITCRALDRFSEMLPVLAGWSPPNATLLLFGSDALRKPIENANLTFEAVNIPDSDQRYLFVCHKR